MKANMQLKTLPVPLARMLLFGGEGGLPPAWGPVVSEDGTRTVWDPGRGLVLCPLGERDPLDDRGGWGWQFPLDEASPWPARIALVCGFLVCRGTIPHNARIVRPSSGYAHVHLYVDVYMALRFDWCLETGRAQAVYSAPAMIHTQPIWVPPLPTLNALLTKHPPAAALLLALYDVEECRQHVDTAPELGRARCTPSR